ncbi:MAG: histidine phosphatase family protein [Clostridia bacterium]|nr:histidine phosphatase family protein [Clostridia bacterium]
MQILDPNFKNYLGENNLEVRKRMKKAIFSTIRQNIGKKIAFVGHGAAIKFFLQEFCTYNKEKDLLEYNGRVVCPRYLESPSMIQIIFKDEVIKNIKYLR